MLQTVTEAADRWCFENAEVEHTTQTGGTGEVGSCHLSQGSKEESRLARPKVGAGFPDGGDSMCRDTEEAKSSMAPLENQWSSVTVAEGKSQGEEN